MNNPIYDCVIVGGGISGISFAHYLNSIKENVLILDDKSKPGGQISTFTPESAPEFWLERGTHTCYNSYTHLLSIISEAGLTEKILAPGKGSYKLYAENQIKSIASEMSFWSFIPGCFRMFGASKEGKSVRDYFLPIVGKKNYEHLFRKLFRAVICQDADDYPAQFFLKKRKERRGDIPRKFSYQHGFSALVDDLIKQGNLNIKTNTPVAYINGEDGIYRIVTGTGEEFLSRNIALSTNPQSVANLVSDFSLEVARKLRHIPLSTSETLSVVVAKDKISMEQVAIVISLSDEFLSIVSRDLFDDPQLRGFSFHFYSEGKEVEDRLRQVCRVLQIKREDILAYSSTFHRLPSARVDHVDLIKQVKDEATKLNHVYLLGNYYYGLSVEDCVHRSHDEFERYRQMNAI